MKVSFDRYSLKLDGERRLIRAGSLHYFRLPAPELWADRIRLMKEAGLNAVDVYYPWNFHSESPGDYDWSGFRDVDRLHDMIEEAGLYLIARPGPYICAEIDMGGLPAWIMRDPQVFPRCRVDGQFTYSVDYMKAVREWFGQVVPRFARRSNLILVQVENEYTVPMPFSGLPNDLVDLGIRVFGSGLLTWMSRSNLVRRLFFRADARALERGQARGQTNSYMRDLCELVREFGVRVPVFHNDLAATTGRQMDVDMIALDRYPIVRFDRDWRDHADTFDVFRGDEAALDAHRGDNPNFYPELQGGWYDGWGGTGYGRVRELLGPEGIDNATKAALVERATLWNYYMFCGGVTWGYLASPDVYTSYDYGAPIGETGRTGTRYDAVRALNAFLESFEEDLAETDRMESEPWSPEHVASRQGPKRKFVFLRNPGRAEVQVPTPEETRATLAPWETQIRVYDSDGRLEGVSPPLPARVSMPRPTAEVPLAPMRWTFSGVAPQIDPAYDDSGWTQIPAELVDQDLIDIDTLGVHYGFIWYRGSFHRPLDRLLLDARHSYAVWVNRELVAVGDQFKNRLGVGPDGARMRRVPVRRLPFQEGRNTIVVLVESLGHHKGFADDFKNPRGIVKLDTGSTPIRWCFRPGLVRGENGIAPVVAFEGVERTGGEEVMLPHGWADDPVGLGLYESRFTLDQVDPATTNVALRMDPGRGKANVYLNGLLIGRYWPEMGPQQRFPLPWGVLRADAENHLAIAVWKRSPRAALGKVRLENA